MTHAFHADDVDVDPDRARELIEAGEVQLVDVREPYEWDAGRIAGARHIEIERLASQAGLARPRAPGAVLLPPRRALRHGRQRVPPRRLRRLLGRRRADGVGPPRAPARARRTAPSPTTDARRARRRAAAAGTAGGRGGGAGARAGRELRQPRARSRRRRATPRACSWSSSRAVRLVKDGQPSCRRRSPTSRAPRTRRRRGRAARPRVPARLRGERPRLRLPGAPGRRRARDPRAASARPIRTGRSRAPGRLVLSVPHTQAANHNGGQLAFGPDGMLYAATGDGGARERPRERRGDHRRRCSARSCGSTRARARPRRTTRSGTPSGPTGCATRGASRSTARRATC